MPGANKMRERWKLLYAMWVHVVLHVVLAVLIWFLASWLFSRASAKAERDLSNLSGVFLCVELGDPPQRKFHRCIPSCYNSLTKGNFDDCRFDLTKKTPHLKFHRCIPSCYTSLTKGNFDDYRFDLTKKTPPAKISQVYTITLHLPY